MRARQRHFNSKDAGANLVLDSRFISGLNDNDPISTWTSRSGGANATASGSNIPVYQTNPLNGLPYVYFAGTNKTMRATFSSSNPSTVVLCSYPTTDVSGFRIMFAGSSNSFAVGYNQSAQVFLATSTVLSASRSRPTTIDVYTGVVNSTSSALRVNGTQVASGSLASFSSTFVNLFTNNVGNFGIGYMGTFFFFPSALGQPILKRVEFSTALSFKKSIN